VCNTLPMSALPQDVTTTSTIMTTLSTESSIKELSCNFEAPCSWNNSISSFNWIVINGSTAASIYNGPDKDHTTNLGYGQFIIPNVLSNISSYATAEYNSPYMIGSKCIEFYYYMYGAQVYLKFILLVIIIFSS
jgi:hypothetical protein